MSGLVLERFEERVLCWDAMQQIISNWGAFLYELLILDGFQSINPIMRSRLLSNHSTTTKRLISDVFIFLVDIYTSDECIAYKNTEKVIQEQNNSSSVVVKTT